MSFSMPEGVTGFSFGDFILPHTDLQTFEKICYHFTVTHRRTNVFFPKEDTYFSYYQANITYEGRTIYVLLNRFYPLIGFSSTNPLVYTFIDEPVLAKMFSPLYQVIPAEELNEVLDIAKQPYLNKADRQEISSWNPRRVGEVIFNFWD